MKRIRKPSLTTTSVSPDSKRCRYQHQGRPETNTTQLKIAIIIVHTKDADIERCVESLIDVVDEMVICDATMDGSIHNWGAWRVAPGNMGMILTRCREIAENAHPNADFGLIIDAGMVLHVQVDIWGKYIRDKNVQGALFTHMKGDISYINIGIIALNCAQSVGGHWEGVGCVHATWQYKSSDTLQQQPLSIATITPNDAWIELCTVDTVTESSLENSLCLLIADINCQPNNSRTLYYLGVVLRDLGRFQEAIYWFKKRCDFSDFPEERWHALYQVGVCAQRLNQPDMAISAYTEAYQYRPSRVEPLARIASMYQDKGLHHIALMYAKAGSSVPYPHNDHLFIERHTYVWFFDFIMSVSLWYINERELAKIHHNKVMDLVSMSPIGVSDAIRKVLDSNSMYFSV
jgi:hypothetical protein